MRIAIIHPYQFRYLRGIERYVWSIAGKWLELGIEVHLITHSWPNEVNWEPLNGIQIHKIPYIRYYRKYFSLPFYVFHLLQQHYDWIILCYADFSESLSILITQRDPTYSIVFHYPEHIAPHRYDAFERHQLVQRAKLLIGVSDYVSHTVEARYRRDCLVIPNGVDTTLFRKDQLTGQKVRSQMGISSTAPILITTAALELRKGIQYVMRAIPLLLSQFPDLQYWVLGEGPDRDQLEWEIEQLGLSEQVKLLGAVENVSDYLSAATVGCLLSWGEAFGISIVEYMACELPVLASNHPPFSSIVPADCGKLIDPNNAKLVAESLRFFMENPDEQKKHGQSGRFYVEQNYSWPSVAQEYVQLFKQATN